MDTNITIPKKEIAPGVFTTGGTATIPVNNPLTNQPNVITPQVLQPTTPINLAGTTPTPTLDTSLVANATQNATNFDTQAEFQRQLDLQKQTTPDQTPLNDILASLTASEQGLTGRGAEQLTAETTAGIPEAQKQRATLQGQIKSQLAEYNALKTEFEKMSADIEAGAGRKGLTTGAVMGQQGAVDRAKLARLNSKASEIGLLQAQDEALAGQIETAQNTVNRAIDLKYQDKEAEYQIKKLQYDRIKDTLTAEEKKRGEAMQNALKKEEERIAEAKENEKAISKMIIEATPNAPANIIANAKAIADMGGSTLEVAQALGKYGGDYLGDKLKRLQITKAGEEINKLRAEIKASTTPISTTNIPSTSTGFVQKLLLTAKNDKNLDTSERQQLSKMGMVISQLDSLQANLGKNNQTGKTGFVVGRVNKLLGDLNLNKDITTINAQIQALIPNVARGIYGEVGVLTDADIANYKKTVANLTNSKDQNDAVLALTLKNALKSYENTLNTASNSGINVSGWAEDYLKIQKQVNTIEDRIGVSKEAVNNLIIKDQNLAPVVKELYQNGLTDGEILEALNAR